MYLRLFTKTLLSLVIVLISYTDCSASTEDAPVGYIRPMCHNQLNWVPPLLKRPFTTLLNNAYCPSWRTRHFVTKQSQYTDIKLPRGIPFAFFCGACPKTSSRLQTNLTVVQTPSYSQDIVLPQVPITGNDGKEIIRQRGQNCRLKYALTGPIKQSGTILCNVQYGPRDLEEKITYAAYDMEIIRSNETIDVPNSKVVLTCPGHPVEGTAADPIVHVWYYPNLEMSGAPRIAAPTTNPTVTFTLSSSSTLMVSCATYHLMTASQVIVTTFNVMRSRSYQLHQGHENTEYVASSYGEAVMSDNNEVNDGNADGYQGHYSYTAGPSIMVIILSIAGSVLGIIFIIGVLKYFTRRTNG